ncbi:hypothetical protein N9V13_07000 [Betaproteobacteria bacterium]|nr:hypothetical protein [Betaproteobacteria bacterium]
MPEKKPNNPFDPWSFLPFSSNPIFPESDSDVAKKIKELKIIETWLNFNLEFTRSVIKTMEIKKEALDTLKDFSKTHKEKGMDEFVDAMNKKIISSSVKNAENWWKSLEAQMGNFIDQTINETTEQSEKKRSVKRTPTRGTSKKQSDRKK